MRMKSGFLALLVLAATGAGASPAQAEHEYKLEMTIGIYAGGFRIFTLDSAAMVGPERYLVSTRGQTEGIFDWILRFVVTGQSEGEVRVGGFQPRHHHSETDGLWRRRGATLRWLDGVPPEATVFPARSDDGRDRVAPAQTVDTVDLLTAIFGRLYAPDGAHPCDGASHVYDGRRRYNLRFTRIGPDKLAATSYAVYAGETVKCRVWMERIAGYRQTVEGEKPMVDDDTAIVWVAPKQDKRPNLPVRLQLNARWGTVVAHLERLTFHPAGHTTATKF